MNNLTLFLKKEKKGECRRVAGRIDARPLSGDAANCTKELGLIHSDNYSVDLISTFVAAFVFILQNRKIMKGSQAGDA